MFVDGVVTQFGQVIGVVVAENQPLAQRAAQAVKITYQDLPSVITIQVSGGLAYLETHIKEIHLGRETPHVFELINDCSTVIFQYY